MISMLDNVAISEAMSIKLEEVFPELPAMPSFAEGIRRAWARNEASIETVAEYNRAFPESNHITLPFIPDETLVRGLVKEALTKENMRKG
jgi:hypothetical protein